MLRRTRHLTELRRLLRRFPVVAILGARQTGKTTLARALVGRKDPDRYFDLESPRDVARLAEPELTLSPLRGLVVLDEIQRRPELFPVLRTLADRPRVPARFLVLGSASPALLRQSSETLAGRIAFHELPGFRLDEVGAESWERLWLRGGFPRSFLASDDADSAEWRRAFVRSYLERELPELGFRIPPGTVTRFWSMLAHYHGQTWNGAELARAFGTSEPTVRGYLDLLCATFLARRLRPFHANLRKREVKSHKAYVADSGVLHTLLSIGSRADLFGHPKVGASFEGFAIERICERLGARDDERFFWAVHSGAELDLLVVRGRRRLGFEVKMTDAPTITPSMRAALAHLRLERLDVVHAGPASYALGDRVRAISIARLAEDLDPLPNGG